MSVKEFYQITTTSGEVYNVKDAQARSDIAAIQSAISGGIVFKGETTTALTDGSITTTITINGESVTAAQGYLVLSGSKEFVFDGTKWIEMGDLSALGNLAWKDTATGSYTPAGTVSQPTFTGSSSTVTITSTTNNSGNYQPAGTVSQPTFTGSSSDVTITSESNASGNYQPAGTVSQPTFTGSSTESTGSFTPAGSVSVSTNATENKTATVSAAGSGDATYTPAGSVSAPTISVATAGSTTTVNSITDVGTLPSLTTTVTNENLIFTWSAGTLPTKGSDTTVKTGDAAYSASAPTFTGTGARLVTGNIAVPSTYTASFSGTAGTVTVSGTPSGTVSQPTFTGTKVQLAGTTTANGSVSQPTFTGTKVQLAGTTTASGTVSQPTFSGTQATIEVS